MMMIFLTLLYLLSYGYWRYRNNLLTWQKTLFFVGGLLIIFLTMLEKISDKLTGLGFNDAVVYHVQYGLEGAGIEKFYPLIIISSLILTSILAFWAYTSFKNQKDIKGGPGLQQTLVPLFALLIIGFHPTLHSIFHLVFPKKSELPMVNFYVQPQLEGTPLNPPNIVWIYGESLERTYMDENAFPGLMPNLKALEKESLSFTDIEQIASTGWTIAGLVGSNCGIPLVVTGGHGNSMDSLPTFLPGAKCFGDLLKGASYSLTFMGGADTVFAGKGKFFKTHGFDEVLGRTELLPLVEDQSYATDWGLYDDSLFKLGLDKFDYLTAKKKPFGLFLLTLDTHHPTGYLSKTCKDDLYGDGTNTILNAVHCSDRLISNLVKEITKRDPNTLVVISSDHLAMNNSVFDQLIKLPRKNLLMFHWPNRVKAELNDRLGSTFSSSSTALNLMGFKNSGIGLGRNLVGEALTLREAISNPQETVIGWEHEFRKLWNIPENPSFLHIDPSRKFVSFSGSIYRLPLIIDISDIDKFPRLIYGNGDAPLADTILKLGPETRSIWLDTCARIFSVIEKDENGNPIETCLWDDRLRKITKIDSSTEYALNK